MTDTSSVPSLQRANDTMHTVGLGEMNLHGFLMGHGIQYGSPEALDFVDAYFRTVAYHAYKANNAIAKEKHESFAGFERSKYADGSYFDTFIERSKPISTDVVRSLFAQYHVEVPSADDWRELAADVVEYGLYAGYWGAVPPTGSISYLSGATSSIHPVAAAIEVRKEGKTGRVYYPAYGLTSDNVNEYKDAYQIGPKAIIDTYAAAQPYVDQGMSLTLFYPDTATTRDLVRNYQYAWRNGVKTLYYMRVRQSALDGTEVSSNVSECISCQL
jgi:ribonucleoside-diphosphate reductase alpha chain